MPNLDEAKKLGGVFDSWIKILVVAGGALVSCATAYYKIFETEKDLTQFKREFKHEVLLIEERAEKRYSRAMESAKELKDYGMYHEKRILELEKENSFLKGKLQDK